MRPSWMDSFLQRNKLFQEKPKLHDYRNQALQSGRNCVIKPLGDDRHFHIQGWGHGLKELDFLLLAHPMLGWEVYRIESLAYWAESIAAGSFNDDPRDMWEATATWVPKDALNPFGFANIRDFKDIKAELLAMRVGSARNRRAQPM
jgi:hypothetical protein